MELRKVSIEAKSNSIEFVQQKKNWGQFDIDKIELESFNFKEVIKL